MRHLLLLPVLRMCIWLQEVDSFALHSPLLQPGSHPAIVSALQRRTWYVRRPVTRTACMASSDGPGGKNDPLQRPRSFLQGSTDPRTKVGIRLRETADHFGEEEENLDPGEKLLRAVKAFDDQGTFLCTGVLVQSSEAIDDSEAWDVAWRKFLSDRDNSEQQSQPVGERQESQKQLRYDLWLCDSLEGGVGPNVQVKGALAVLDCLFLHHLRHSAPGDHLRVFADGEFASASRIAAQMRGFTFQVEERTGEEILMFDSRHRGPEAYTREVLSTPGTSSVPVSVLFELSQRRQVLRLPVLDESAASGAWERVWLPAMEEGDDEGERGSAWEGGVLGVSSGAGLGVQVASQTLGNATRAVVTGLLGAGEGGTERAELVDAEWVINSGQSAEDGGVLEAAGRGGEEWSVELAVGAARRRLRKFRIVKGMLGPEEAAAVQREAEAVAGDGDCSEGGKEERRGKERGKNVGRAGGGARAGGWAEEVAIVAGGELSGVAAGRAALRGLALGLEEGVVPAVRLLLGAPRLELRSASLRQHSAASAASAAGRGGEGGVAVATAVVALGGSEGGGGGVYLQCGAHAASRREVPLEGGDMLLFGYDVRQGSEAFGPGGWHLELKFGEGAAGASAEDGGEGAEGGRGGWLRRAAEAGDDEAQRELARMLEREAEGAEGESGGGGGEGGGRREALRWRLASAAQGNAGALTELGSRLAAREEGAEEAGEEEEGRGGALLREAGREWAGQRLPAGFVEVMERATAAEVWGMAAVQGWGEAQYRLGEAQRDGAGGAGVDAEGARRALLLAAQQGHAGASFALAQLLLFEAQSRGLTPRKLAESRGAAGGEKASGSDARVEREGGGERRRGVRERVRVSGVKLKDGMPDTWCCGEYAASGEEVHGRAVYHKVGDSRFALWYDELGMWRLGDRGDVGSAVGRASVESRSLTPAGPHLAPWTVFVWSGREVGGTWTEQETVQAAAVGEGRVPSAQGTAWEPLELGPEDWLEEGCFWLQEAARRGHAPARELAEQIGIGFKFAESE